MSVEWLTPSQVAEHIQVPLATVRAWRYRGVGPTGYRIGKHVRYRRDEVDAWVLSGASTAA